MKIASFAVPKALADLKDSRISSRQQAFHTQFRRPLQVTAASANEVNVNFRGRRRNELGCFHLQIIVFNKKPPDRLNQAGT
jgi:hypothetical protein